MAPKVKHEPHCRYCTNVATSKNHGHWTCADHERYLPWGMAVLSGLKEQKKVVNEELKTVSP
jgi:hypothetical protein